MAGSKPNRHPVGQWYVDRPLDTDLVEVAVLGPGRPPKGIVLDSEVAMRAEPDASLEARMKMRAGVTVEVLGSGSGWTKIRAEGLTGYVKSDSVAVVD